VAFWLAAALAVLASTWVLRRASSADRASIFLRSAALLSAAATGANSPATRAAMRVLASLVFMTTP
jgi:hypothetical protein